MALQVWLPLNGSLKNQGVSGATFTSVGTWSYGAGKVTSQSMVSPNPSSSSATAFVYTTSTFKYTKNFSISVWVKLPSANSSYASYIATEGRADATNYGWGLQGNATSLTARFGNGSNAKSSLTANTWHLATITVDNSSKCSFYVDGILNGSFTPSTLPTYAEDNGIGIGLFRYASGNIYQWNGSINDFRLYNHCLSIKEIKNLAKGLMLHYTLSRPQANLLKNTATEKSWTYSGTSYSDSNYSQETITPASGSYYTMSFDAKSNRNSTSNFITYLFNNNSGRQCDNVKGYIDGQLVYTGSASDGTCVMPTYTYYRHYTIIRHFNSNATALTKQNVFRIYNAGSNGLTMYVKNAKIELGDKSTPWIPNSTDSLYTSMGFNRNIEDDTSGYNNNGTRTNITTWNTDTARYLSSMTFASNSYVKTNAINFNGTTNNYTISWWGNFSSASSAMFWGFSDGNRLNLYMSNNYFYWNTGDGGANPFYSSGTTQLSASPYADSKWHHFTIVGNGTSVILYIDGSQKATAKTYKNITGTIIYINGWDTSTSYKFNGRMSDFRIYATALSADDVKELYNVGASIDKNGNMHCYELVES